VPADILEVELAGPLADREGLRHPAAVVLVRLDGRPRGLLRIPCPDRRLPVERLRTAIEADRTLRRLLAETAVRDALLGPPAAPAALPSWTVVVCTRDRTDDLRRCLDSLLTMDAPPEGEIVVVDNAPSTDATEQLVAGYPAGYPSVRYVRESRPGLNWARSRGAHVARGQIVAYTDDDVVVDPRWIRRLLPPFAGSRVAAVTGLAMPLELETEAQELFELYGGFGRGFESWTFDYQNILPAEAGRVGAGANMAIRRSLLLERRLFESELDCGTVARTGGDTYAFYLLIADGWRIVYTPEALVWHRHRRDHASLRRSLYDYSVGGYAFLTRCLVEHGDWDVVKIAAAWLLKDHVRKLARSLLRLPGSLPLALSWSYLRGVPVGPLAYRRSCERERSLPALFAPAISGPAPAEGDAR
jgi:glycosyltransferase involved in cell wall biosynthesis